MNRIIVTGGSGFIGTNLIQHCFAGGHEVLNIDLRPPKDPAAPGSFVQADILDRHVLIETVRDFDPEYIIHLAARTDLDGTTDGDYDANIQGVSNIVAASKEAPKLKRAIFASSMYVCKLGYVPRHDDDYCPHTAYGHSKQVGEQLVRQQAGDKFCWTLVRPTSIWGPWFNVPYRGFFDTVRKGFYVHPTGYEIRRSYGFVLNTVVQISRLLEVAENDMVHGKVFYVADYEPTDPLYWAQTIADRFGSRQIRRVPIAAMRLGARVGDFLKSAGMRNPPLSSFRLNNLLTNAVFDLNPTRQVAGDLPYTLEQGVQITVDWMRRQEGANLKRPNATPKKQTIVRHSLS
ncbi:MAG TPA: NAD(P)-dependent oxidoreductase [Terriglobales bacterium]|nr:NAD(P)-dependent oxidoreductase [Terriglobales bacterium]